MIVPESIGAIVYLSIALLAVALIVWQYKIDAYVIVFLTTISVSLFIYRVLDLQSTIILSTTLVLFVGIPAIKKLYSEGIIIGKLLGHKKLLLITLKSLILVTPLVMVFMSVQIHLPAAASEWLQDDVIYKIEISDKNFTCNDSELFCNKPPNSFKENIDSTIANSSDGLRNVLEGRVKVELSKIKAGTTESKTAIENKLFGSTNSIFPKSIQVWIKPPKCKWYDWFSDLDDCIKNKTIKAFDDAYIASVSELHKRTMKTLNESDQKVHNTSNVINENLKEFVSSEISIYETKLLNLNDTVFRVFSLLNIVSLIINITIIIKGYFYIKSRMIFDRDFGKLSHNISEGPFSFKNDKLNNGIEVRNITRSQEGGFSQKLDGNIWYSYDRMGISVENKGRFTFPRLGHLFFKHIFSVPFGLTKITPSENVKDFNANANNTISFVRIGLPKNKEIYFNMRDLVAVSDNVQFSGRYILSYFNFLLCNFYFTTARGTEENGMSYIILKANGGVVKIMPDTNQEGSDCSELIAYDIDANFSTFAATDPVSVYIKGISMITCKNTFAIRGSSHIGRRRILPLINKMKFFFVPF